MKAPVSTFHSGCFCGRDELSHLGHISFGSLSGGFNNRKASHTLSFSVKPLSRLPVAAATPYVPVP